MRQNAYALFLMLWILVAGAYCVRAADTGITAGVNITPQPDGGFLVATVSYQARIGNDGNLHSLVVNGVEFLDDQLAGSLGASFFVERPIALPQLKQQASEIIATDGIYTVRYLFAEGYVTVTIRHTNPDGAAYVAVSSPRVAFIEDLSVNTMAAIPVDYNWPNVRMTAPTGEFVEFKGGTRVWGREIGRQIWECSNIVPNKDYSLMFIPGRDIPPAPDLGRLVTLSVSMDPADQLVPAGDPAVIQVRFDNNSNQSITTEMAIHVESSQGNTLLDEHKPFTCEAHESVTLPWTLQPEAPDFYRITCAANLNGSVKSFATTFGYNRSAIKPPVECPKDFTAYWERIVAEAKGANVKLTMLEDTSRSTSTVRVYEIGINADGFIYSGWLAVPRFPGRYPGLLLLPSDRVRFIGPNPGLADFGFVVMSIEPTGQPIRGTLKPLITQAMTNLTSTETFGMRAIMIRYLCAVTALASVPEVDAARIAVTGAGLGGGMAMILAAVDERIQAVAPDVPYLCHIALGSTRADWPYLEIADYLHEFPEQYDVVINTLNYYDVANFAERITCPVFMSAGISDTYSRPTNILGVHNLLPGPRALKLYLAGHEGGGVRHWEEKINWLKMVLGGPSPVIPDVPTAPAVPPVLLAPPAPPAPIVPDVPKEQIAPSVPSAPIAPVSPDVKEEAPTPDPAMPEAPVAMPVEVTPATENAAP